MIEIEDGGPHHWQAPRLTPIMAWCQAKPYSYSSEFPEAYFRQLDCCRSSGVPSTCRFVGQLALDLAPVPIGGRENRQGSGGRLAVILRGERAKRQGRELVGEGDVDYVLLLRVVDGAVALGGGRHGLAAAVARADLAAVEDARGGHDAVADEIPGALVLGLLLGPDDLRVGVRRGVRGDLVERERRNLLDADEPAWTTAGQAARAQGAS